MPSLRTFICLSTLACAAWPLSGLSLDRTKLTLDNLAGDGWQAQQVQVMLQLSAQPLRAQVKIAHATLRGLDEPLRDLVIDCQSLQLSAQEFSCTQATISGTFPYLGKQKFNGVARYARSNGAISVSFKDLQLAKGSTQLRAQLNEAGWQAQLGLRSADLAELLKLARKFSIELDLNGTGNMNAQVKAQGQGATPTAVEWQLQGQAITLGNAAGSLATDTLGFSSKGDAHRQQGWQFDTQTMVDKGQGYAEPVFVDFTQHALSLQAQGNWDGDKRLHLQQLILNQQDIVDATAQGELQLDMNNPVPVMQVQIAELKFPGSFATYAQPFLIGGSFKNLNTSGVLNGSLQIINTAPEIVDMQLHSLHADGGNVMLDQVNGDIHWQASVAADAAPPRSTLSWQSGNLLGLELGATQLQLELWDTNARIAEPTRIPIFNGALAIDAFRVRKAGLPEMAFMLDAVIEPINVAQLSKAFGWPEFGGALSGKVTKLRMEDGVLSLGATLTAQIFAGDASISDMRLEGALTQWPRFTADIAFKQLDLEQVTQAFSFGRITGRLSGEINQLELFNWQPVAFDAHLYTPAKDRSKHRISQRAVQNIGSVGGSGGGVTAALQSGFLKFFEDFNYDKLGLSCKLVDDVCLMNGIAPAKNGGYYLVKGKGLPRIDVIGNATRVDWPRLVAQLKAVTESEGPVIK